MRREIRKSGSKKLGSGYTIEYTLTLPHDCNKATIVKKKTLHGIQRFNR